MGWVLVWDIWSDGTYEVMWMRSLFSFSMGVGRLQQGHLDGLMEDRHSLQHIWICVVG